MLFHGQQYTLHISDAIVRWWAIHSHESNYLYLEMPDFCLQLIKRNTFTW